LNEIDHLVSYRNIRPTVSVSMVRDRGCLAFGAGITFKILTHSVYKM